MNKIAQYLNQHLAGNVFDKPAILEAYATDHSAVKVMPKLVALPEDTQDVRKIARFVDRLAAKKVKLPITIRGRGNDKTGAAVGNGIVVSMEKMNHIQEIDARSRMVRVQAGVTLGELNTALSMHGLTLPIDAAPSETIGGLIANCPTDGFTDRYGGIYNYVDRAEVVLANGDCIQTMSLNSRALNRRKGSTMFEGALYRNLEATLDQHGETLALIASGNLDSAGYATASLVREGRTFDLLPLLFSSQGTLGLITEVILRCEILPPEPQHFIAIFGSARPMVEFLEFAKTQGPRELDIYDLRLLKDAAKHGKKIDIVNHRLNSGFLVYGTFDNKPFQAKRKLKKCLSALPDRTYYVAENKQNSLAFQDLANALISYLNDDIHGERTPLLDDTSIPSTELANFLSDLKQFESTFGQELPLFGSFATGNYTVRPEIHLSTVEGRQSVLKFIRGFSALVRNHGGSVTGGAPEGRIKAMVAQISDDERTLYRAIKEAFDPHDILNPDIKLAADVKTTVKHLRTSPAHRIID